MDIPVNAEVYCTDGHCGRSTSIIVERATDRVTHLVVRQKPWPHIEVLVPVAAVTAATPDSINLSYSREELAKQQDFIETEYLGLDLPRYAGGAYVLGQEAYGEPGVVFVQREAIPAGELAVERGAPVEATDGHVGQVDEFLVDPANDRITHLVLREGHLWGKRDITIPVSQINRIEGGAVYLKLDKRSVEALPAARVQR